MAHPDYVLLHQNEGKAEHVHDYAQIYIPLETELDVRCNHILFKVMPQELGFLPPDVPHQCLCKNELIVINIPKSMIKKGDLEILQRKVVLPIEGSLVSLVELIRLEVGRNSASMRYLYYYLYDRLVENNSFRSLQYIRQHFDEPIAVAELAALEGYSVAHFNDWFRQQTGFTPSHYLRLYRIEKAKEFLMYTSYNVLEIAVQVGYNSHAAFSRAFREAVGCSPAEYRAMADEPSKIRL